VAKDVWIEVALNGPWGQARQPGIPVTVADIVEQGVACVQAGAAIVHAHAYDEQSGQQKDDWQIYARIIEGIRAKVDAVVYPTIPIAGSGYAGDLRTAQERYAHLEELARRGLVEWAVVDPGSVNFSRLDDLAPAETGFVYLNPEDHIREGLRICGQYGVRPSYAIYEPGFTRLGAKLANLHPALPAPLYRFMFSDEFAWGFPPRIAYLEAHLELLEEVSPGAHWMVAGLGVDATPLIAPAVARGGHVRVGLEDACWGSEVANVQWVERAVKQVRLAWAEPALAHKVREVLRSPPQQNPG
jgi:uncharacterized protein (DUF849 family)